MKELRESIRKLEILTWPAAILIVTLYQYFGPIYSNLATGAPLRDQRIVFAITTSLYLLLFVLAKTTFLRNRTIADAPFLSISTLVLLCLVNSAMVRVISVVWFHQPTDQYSIVRIVTINIAIAAWHIMIALWVGETKQHKKELELHELQIRNLTDSESNSMSALRESQVKTIAKIEQTLSLAWKKLTPDSKISEQLIRIVNEVVRPLSRELAIRDVAQIEENFRHLKRISFKDRMVRWRNLLKTVSLYDPSFTPIILAVLPYMSRSYISLPAGAERSLFISYLLFLGAMKLGKLIEARYRYKLSGNQLFSIAAFLLLLTSLSDSVFFALNSSRIGLNSFSITMISDVLIVIAVFTIRLVILDRRQILLDMAELTERIRWTNARISQLIWVEKQRLSNLVHGHIQNQIVATAMKFESAIVDQKSTSEIIKKLNSDLQEIMVNHNRTEAIQKFLASLGILWAFSIQIKSFVDERVSTLLVADQDAADAITEVIRECINNAAKHSLAKNVEINLSLDTASQDGLTTRGYFKLAISNDGTISNDQVGDPGLGSAFFDSVTSNWSLEMRGEVTRFSALIPFATH